MPGLRIAEWSSTCSICSARFCPFCSLLSWFSLRVESLTCLVKECASVQKRIKPDPRTRIDCLLWGFLVESCRFLKTRSVKRLVAATLKNQSLQYRSRSCGPALIHAETFLISGLCDSINPRLCPSSCFSKLKPFPVYFSSLSVATKKRITF
jgi:hypothetical protein